MTILWDYQPRTPCSSEAMRARGLKLFKYFFRRAIDHLPNVIPYCVRVIVAPVLLDPQYGLVGTDCMPTRFIIATVADTLRPVPWLFLSCDLDLGVPWYQLRWLP